MDRGPFREILVFVIGTTPQIITETLYALTQEFSPPVIPEEIHIITTSIGKEKIEEELIKKARLSAFSKEFGLPEFVLSKESIHVIESENGQWLEDIRDTSHNEKVGDFIVNFIREKTSDPSARLHCSLAGGRKTMSFYLGSALQLFGRPWDKLYHVLVTPEFESHPEFYYKPKKDRLLDLKNPKGRRINKLHTKEARISLAELPFIRLRDKIPLNGKGFKELVSEGQKEIDMASIQPPIRVHLKERMVSIGEVSIDMVPIQIVIYTYLLRQKMNGCTFPDQSYCLNCTDCFLTLGELSKRKALEEMAEDYKKIYGPFSGRVEEFTKHWNEKGGIDSDTLRQNISKINSTLKEHLDNETLYPYYAISPVGKHGSKRYGIRVEKNKIFIEP
ncbi:MAG: CRISPR-associated ring nuclease Csm6 [Thermodesulfobacteriota bacterium]